MTPSAAADTATTEFRMPSLGADMDSGTIVEWLVKPGDAVQRGQVVAVVDTAKAAIEIEVFTDGVVEQILVEPGQEVPVGTPLATIAVVAAAAAAPAAPTRSSRVAMPPVRHLAHQLGVDIEGVPGTGVGGSVTRRDVMVAAEPAGSVESEEPAGPTGPAGPVAAVPRHRATPLARRLAEELGVDLAEVTGSGKTGAVTAKDVRAAGRAAEPSTQTEPAEPAQPARSARRRSASQQAAMRSAIAALMARSKREIPHYYVQQTLDLTPALEWLLEHNAGRGVGERVLPAALLARAVVVALDATGELNGHWTEDRFHPARHVDLGIAVSMRGGGMVAPAIEQAEDLGLDDLMQRFADLVRRARTGRLRQSEMAGGSVTISNLGEDGAEALTGVIYPPQVALVGFGGIVERPWAVDGMLTVRRTVTVTLAADHRASDGRTACKFVAALVRALHNPEEM